MGFVVGIVSGKGGTGKTSVCAGVSIALAGAGLKVLCIDCDMGLQNLDISLGMTDSGTLSFLDVSEGGYALGQAPRHPQFPTLSFLTAPMNRSLRSIDTVAFGDMLRQARELFDYILLDAPAGVDAGFRLVAGVADRFLLVTGAGPAAVRDAARVGELLELLGKADVRLVVNRVNRNLFTLLKMTVDDVMDQSGLPLIGVVLDDQDVPLAAAVGMSLVRYSHRSYAAIAYQKISRRIQGLNEPITLK